MNKPTPWDDIMKYDNYMKGYTNTMDDQDN